MWRRGGGICLVLYLIFGQESHDSFPRLSSEASEIQVKAVALKRRHLEYIHDRKRIKHKTDKTIRKYAYNINYMYVNMYINRHTHIHL